MFVIPNSSAMDATAYGGGPGTFVAQIATGSPESIEALVAQRLKQAEQFLALINQARSATQTLSKAWGGNASETAVKKFTDTLNSFEQIVKVIQASSQLLTTSSTLIKAAQTGYTTVVNAVNPTVASLASNWYTYWAAVSLSTSVSATLRAFINGIEAMLSALGGGQLMQEVTEVIKIIGDVEKLIGSGSHGSSVPPAGAFTSPTATGATNQLKAPPQVASTTGQQVAASGVDPTAARTLSQYQNTMNSGIGTQFQNGAQTTGTQTPGTQIPVHRSRYTDRRDAHRRRRPVHRRHHGRQRRGDPGPERGERPAGPVPDRPDPDGEPVPAAAAPEPEPDPAAAVPDDRLPDRSPPRPTRTAAGPRSTRRPTPTPRSWRTR